MFEKLIEKTFEKIQIESERVGLDSIRFFVCGGLVDASQTIPPSFRDRFLSYTAAKHPNLHDAIILAEKFKDYFKENAYPDLLAFEEDIASISTLVIIFLESPGSLVELGMFCNKPNYYKKLVVVAPQDKVEAEDSFIYLGPLEYIKKKEESSVLIYPWPDSQDSKYDADHLIDLCEAIERKLAESPKNILFDKNNSGHVSLLIADIVRVFYPILENEIELALIALDVNVRVSDVRRHIYLLQKLELICSYKYSGFTYFYSLEAESNYLSFVKSRAFDRGKLRMKISGLLASSDQPLDRKRRTALKEISKILRGDSE